MLIDDEIAILSVTESFLKRLGYDVSVYSDSEEALSAIHENPQKYDMIITDYSMPKISGLAVIKSMKEKMIDVPVILMSGYIDVITEEKIKDYGVEKILTKPISVYELSDTVNKILKSNGIADP